MTTATTTTAAPAPGTSLYDDCDALAYSCARWVKGWNQDDADFTVYQTVFPFLLKHVRDWDDMAGWEARDYRTIIMLAERVL